MQRQFCIQFWDGDAWNEMSNTRCYQKATAIEQAQELNRTTSHRARQDFFGGHRYRVRSVEKPTKKLKRFYVRADCGCCTLMVEFYSKDRLLRALRSKTGFVVDDTGTTFDNLDPWYGFSETYF